MNDEHFVAMVENAGLLLAAQKLSKEKVHEESVGIYGKLADANILAWGTLGAALTRAHGKIGRIDASTIARESLIAAFVMGMDMCQDAITNGYYIQAGALIRQELEIVAAIEEVKKGLRQEGKSPNVKHVEWELARLYGNLSEIAHVSVSSIVRECTEVSSQEQSDIYQGRLYPELNSELSRRMYALHTALIILVANHVHEAHTSMHGVGLNQAEIAGLNYAMHLMVDEKCMELAVSA